MKFMQRVVATGLLIAGLMLPMFSSSGAQEPARAQTKAAPRTVRGCESKRSVQSIVMRHLPVQDGVVNWLERIGFPIAHQ